MADPAGQRSLQDRVALVTGASGGIGTAVAWRLAQHGAAVACHYGSNADAAHQVARRIRASGGRASALGADLRDPAAPDELIDAVERDLGPVDALVANAGIVRPLELAEIGHEEFDELMAVNLRAPFMLARRVVPGMRERGFGRVLFTSSVAAFTGGLVGPHYAASKAGLHAIVHYLARRVAPDGVTVNAIAPALIRDTGDLSKLGDVQELARNVPVGRLGTPAEVADMALAMLRNAYLTNQVVLLDGGMHPR
ncbi:MAG: 3-oxoacyl-[acyl-carrier protein] reductase [Thermoleophilaceae bacterium]|nr:3-oxoacyl-[acyl-carrier protein] reductase [Thermoleophilaceae bacterium]